MDDGCAFLVCGEALIDLVPLASQPEPVLRAVCGGSPYNVAIGLGRLGAETQFLGRLSRDANGRRLADRLSDNGVDLALVATGSLPRRSLTCSRRRKGGPMSATPSTWRAPAAPCYGRRTFRERFRRAFASCISARLQRCCRFPAR